MAIRISLSDYRPGATEVVRAGKKNPEVCVSLTSGFSFSIMLS